MLTANAVFMAQATTSSRRAVRLYALFGMSRVAIIIGTRLIAKYKSNWLCFWSEEETVRYRHPIQMSASTKSVRLSRSQCRVVRLIDMFALLLFIVLIEDAHQRHTSYAKLRYFVRYMARIMNKSLLKTFFSVNPLTLLYLFVPLHADWIIT